MQRHPPAFQGFATDVPPLVDVWPDLLEHLGGLDSLRRVGGSLSVYNNERLNSVDALGGLEHVELNFNILNNPQLPCHEAETLVSALGEGNVGGDVSVLNNGEEVGASCL